MKLKSRQNWNLTAAVHSAIYFTIKHRLKCFLHDIEIENLVLRPVKVKRELNKLWIKKRAQKVSRKTFFLENSWNRSLNFERFDERILKEVERQANGIGLSASWFVYFALFNLIMTEDLAELFERDLSGSDDEGVERLRPLTTCDLSRIRKLSNLRDSTIMWRNGWTSLSRTATAKNVAVARNRKYKQHL